MELSYNIVLYFKEKCTCFSPLSPTMSSGGYGIFHKKILLPSKISLLLNRLIKKIFLPHINSIAALSCPAQSTRNEPVSLRSLNQMDVEPYFLLKNVNFAQAIGKLELLSGNNIVHKNFQIQTYCLPVIQVLVLKIMTPLR